MSGRAVVTSATAWRYVVVVAAAAAAAAGPGPFVQLPLTVGAWVVVALVAGRDLFRRGAVTTPAAAAALTGGGSLVIAVLVAVLLDLTPWGLRPWTWSVAVAVVELTILATVRADSGPGRASWLSRTPVPSTGSMLWGSVAVILVGAALAATFLAS